MPLRALRGFGLQAIERAEALGPGLNALAGIEGFRTQRKSTRLVETDES